MTRVGLIARCDDRGIATITHEFFLNMKPAKTLLIEMVNDPFPQHPERYAVPVGCEVGVYQMDPKVSLDLPVWVMEDFLRDLDVVFAHETVYDWRLIDMARERGVKTVIQANPELHRSTDISPDVWCWPTPWLIDHMPSQIVLPVPTPDHQERAAPDADWGEALCVLHVAGHAAIGDRNGTLDFMRAVEMLQTNVLVTVIGQDGWLPECKPPRNVRLITHSTGVPNRWDMYRGNHLVVLPRRYGGLSLPCQEAMASGCAVMMTDCAPNDFWPTYLTRSRRGRLQLTPYGRIQTYDAEPRSMAAAIDNLNRDRDALDGWQKSARDWAHANSWRNLRPQYEAILAT
jgi:glycosyltransferase involved in cell wall biosynthesis